MRYGDFYFNPNAPNVVVPRTGTLIRNFYKGFQKPPLGSEITRSHPLAKLIASCFLFNEGSGSIAYDLNRNTKGIIQPGVTWENSPLGPSLLFGGSSTQYVLANPIYVLAGQTNFSVFAQIRTTAGTTLGGRAIYAERGSSGNDILKMDSLDTGSNQLGFTYRNDGGTLTQAFGTTPINDGKWHYVIIVRDAWGLFVYVDNILSASAARTGNDNLTNATLETRIGADKGDSGANWSGNIGFVYTWRRSLNTNEIRWLNYEPFAFLQPPLHKRYFFSAPNVAAATAAVTGTAVPSATETEIVVGGETIIITLTNDTWVAAGAAFDAQRANIIQGLDSAQSELTGWNNEVRDKEVVGAVVRTSNTVVTITLSASALYNITANETITVTVPATAVTGGVAITATPTFDVTFTAAAAAYNPWRMMTGVGV